MNKRKAKIIFNKNGKGYNSYKVSLPTEFIKKLEITEEDRNVIVEYIKDRIIIKKQNKEDIN